MAGTITFFRVLVIFFATLLLLVTSSPIPRPLPGGQFITGACKSDSDCSSQCCGFNSGKCAGPVVAQERDGGCGFGDAQPNNKAAQAIQGPNAQAASGVNNNGGGGGASSSSTTSSSSGNGNGDGTGNNGSGNNGASGSNSAAAPAGTQFITGACKSDSDCASSCCGFKSGKCAGPVVAQERDGGCGFGDAQPNDKAAKALQGGGGGNKARDFEAFLKEPATKVRRAPAPAGTQFITGACKSDSDCASSCCGFNSGKCAGPVVAQERDGGCGFGDAKPNNKAAQAVQGPNAQAAAGVGNNGGGGGASSRSSSSATSSSSTGNGNNGNSGSNASGSGSAAAPAGTQFITGACKSDSDCASSCCGFKSGKCAGPVVAQERDGGCGFGDAQPNDKAAKALQGGGGGNKARDFEAFLKEPATKVRRAPAPAGTQFITGACKADSDCASSCCGFNSGKCAGPVVAQERDGGCGFGDAQPNNKAAQAVQGPNAQAAQGVNGGGNGNGNNNSNGGGGGGGSNGASGASSTSTNSGSGNDNTGNGNGNGAGSNGSQSGSGSGSGTASAAAPAGTQFITGQCSSDSVCASGCCGFNSGKCAGPVVAQERDGGCGFGDAQPNDNAAKALQGGGGGGGGNANRRSLLLRSLR